MWRFLSLSMLFAVLLLAPSTAKAADDDDPKLQGKRLSEWIEQLRGDQAPATRKTLLLALGSTASPPAVLTPWETKLREIGLLAVSLYEPKKNPKIFAVLVTALRSDPDDNLRFKAAQALGRLGGKVHDEQKEKGTDDIRLGPVCEGLSATLRGDKVTKVREASARALGQLKEDGRDGVPVLVASLQDPSEDIQAAAAESLRILGETLAVSDALPQIEEALKNPKTGTLARVQLALTIGIVGRKSTIDTKVLRELLKAEKTPADLRIAIVETLGKVGTYSKSDAVGDITAVLGEKDLSGELRYACVAALDNFGPTSLPALAELRKCMMQDKNKYVRTTAMHAIGGIGKYLGSDSTMVVADLLTNCNDPIYEVRVAAIETLGNLGADAIGPEDLKKVLVKLDELNKDSQRGIREAAMNSQKKLKPVVP